MGKEWNYEAERRRKLAEEKAMGALIEALERMRKQPVARSIMLRLYFLYMTLHDFSQIVKAMGMNFDPIRTQAPSFTKEQTNLLIKTYNSIIEDLRTHLRAKDSYVNEFSTLNELDEPTINDVAKNILHNGNQYSTNYELYVTRWTK